MIGRQLPLGLDPPARATFESFWVGRNGPAVAALCEAAESREGAWIALSGGPGSGKSHLLAATARATRGAVLAAGPTLRRIARPAELVDLAGTPLLCLDDLDALLGERAWEEALFNLLDRQRRGGHGLVFAAELGPRELTPELRDLGSRLRWGSHWRLRRLDDGEKAALLRHRAGLIGVTLDERTIAFMLAHLPRDLGALNGWLDRIAAASLAAQRRIGPRLVGDVLRASRHADD